FYPRCSLCPGYHRSGTARAALAPRGLLWADLGSAWALHYGENRRSLSRTAFSPNYSSASKSIRESLSGAELRLTTTVSQERHGPLTNSSGRPDPTLIGLLVESGRNASCQPPRAYIYRFALGPTGLSIERTGPARSHARRLIRSNYA